MKGRNKMKNRLKLYVRSAFAAVHVAFVKLFNIHSFSAGILQDFSLGTKIHPGSRSRLKLGKKIHTMGDVLVETMDGGNLEIGDGCVFNNGVMIVSGCKISIGAKTGLGPNVMVYDHDHEINRTEENENSYRFSPVTIGSRVWVGANSVILRGSVIGDGCVIGAGCVIKGTYPPNTVVIQRRTEETREIRANTEVKGGECIGGTEEHTRLEGLVQST